MKKVTPPNHYAPPKLPKLGAAAVLAAATIATGIGGSALADGTFVLRGDLTANPKATGKVCRAQSDAPGTNQLPRAKQNLPRPGATPGNFSREVIRTKGVAPMEPRLRRPKRGATNEMDRAAQKKK